MIDPDRLPLIEESLKALEKFRAAVAAGNIDAFAVVGIRRDDGLYSFCGTTHPLVSTLRLIGAVQVTAASLSAQFAVESAPDNQNGDV